MSQNCQSAKMDQLDEDDDDDGNDDEAAALLNFVSCSTRHRDGTVTTSISKVER